MNYNKIHIGKLVQTFVKENNIKSAELARKVGKTRQNIYDLYKRDDMEVKLLLTISDVLRHNFLEDLYPSKQENISIDAIFDALKRMVEKEIRQ